MATQVQSLQIGRRQACFELVPWSPAWVLLQEKYQQARSSKSEPLCMSMETVMQVVALVWEEQEADYDTATILS